MINSKLMQTDFYVEFQGDKSNVVTEKRQCLSLIFSSYVIFCSQHPQNGGMGVRF